MRLAAVFAALFPALLACGQAPSDDAAYRDGFARRVDPDCRGTEAPTPEAARDLRRLCDCTGRGIRASDMSARDNEQEGRAKLTRVQDACLAEIYAETPAAGNAAR